MGTKLNKDTNTHYIIGNFKDSEVRILNNQMIPSMFREWDSIKETFPAGWGKTTRIPNQAGYPPFDIFSHWLMDFATISAYQLNRNDWQNYRKMHILHVPTCPLRCWYCFNDAWGKDKEKVKSSSAEEILSNFLSYREYTLGKAGKEINILRISGGEPFEQPDLIRDLAKEFSKYVNQETDKQYREPQKLFLWVDTNLYHLKGNNPKIEQAFDELIKLGKHVAIHACLHGADVESYKRNTGVTISNNTDIEGNNRELQESLGKIVNFEKNRSRLNVYPRINPIGLSYDETEKAFNLLKSVESNLPLRTYLGPIEFSYEQPLVRMEEVKNVSRNDITLYPENVCIYRWNELLEKTYGIGYAKIPRYLTQNIPKIKGIGTTKTHFENILLLCKGWEKEVYSRKLLELLALPKESEIELEFENKWVESSLLTHAKTFPEMYKGQKVLCIAGTKKDKPDILPLRWCYITNLRVSNCQDIQQDFIIKLKIGDYANEFQEYFDKTKRKEAFLDYLSKYIGQNNIPFAGKNASFCKYVGIPTQKLSNKDNSFKDVVTYIVDTKYDKAKLDVYYRVKEIKEIKDGILVVGEDSTIQIEVESFNHNLDNPGYPKVSDLILSLSSTNKDYVEIYPEKVELSKYGITTFTVKFARKGEYKGDLIFEPLNPNIRIASFRIPFKTEIR